MIYLDHASTSFPKPPGVLAAIADWYTRLGVSADRGSSAASAEVKTRVAAVRQRLARHCGVPAARLAFTSGATESLNLALRALLRPGDRVLTTAFEHSAVARPLLALQQERDLRVSILPPAADGGLDPDAVDHALALAPHRLLVATHGSNVTGARLDAAAFAAHCRRHGALFVLDASQTAGLCDLAVGADVVAGSAHKALHGPPGLGFLAARAGLELPPQKQGGTGSSTATAEQPHEWPQAHEAGTPNTPAILGLGAALDWLDRHAPGELLQRLLAHRDRLEAGLRRKPGVRVLPAPAARRLPVLSFVHRDLDPAELGLLLDAAGVQVRTGFHCAPWLHDHLGTAGSGTVRLSPGPELDDAALDAALAAIPD